MTAVQTMSPIIEMLTMAKTSMLAALPSHIDRERFMQVCMGIAKQDNLRECTPKSFLLACYGCSRLGLIPDPVLGHVHIVPQRVNGVTEAQIRVGYQGYIELAGRSRAIAAIHAEAVYANDEFDEIKGTERKIIHRPWYVLGASSAGDLRFAYVTWRDLRSNTIEHHVITQARVDAAKGKSASASGRRPEYSPWSTSPDAMWKKTAVLDARKVWPLTAEMSRAMGWDFEADRGERQSIPTDAIEITATVVERPSLADLDPPASSEQSAQEFADSIKDELTGGEA
jgi:recombination protein RecT